MLNKLMHVPTLESYLELKWSLHELKMSFGYYKVLTFIFEDCLLLQYNLVCFELIYLIQSFHIFHISHGIGTHYLEEKNKKFHCVYSKN